MPQLTGFGASGQFIEHVCWTVEKQMLSALYHWTDIPFRKALLLLASEEGTFYEPGGKTEVKCFVVLTLRNSPFETMQSESYQETGLSKSLSDAQIKVVTSAAIVYFKRLCGTQAESAARSLLC